MRKYGKFSFAAILHLSPAKNTIPMSTKNVENENCAKKTIYKEEKNCIWNRINRFLYPT